MGERRPEHRRYGRAGAVLIEVLVALTILATAGVSALALASASAHSVRHAAEAERAVLAASDYLDVVALWPREDLDRHLGDRAQGDWAMRTDRADSTLYDVALSDSGGRVLVRTTLYRPVSRP